MALSFDIRLTWEQFWENQQDNPNCELAFFYNGKIYYLCYETNQTRAWKIYEAGVVPEDRGTESFGKCLKVNCDKIQKHHGYLTEEEWMSTIDSCYKLLTTPIWNGKSFKDEIEKMFFES